MDSAKQIKVLYSRSIDIIDSMWVIYRIDNPSARLVTDTEKDAIEGQKILTSKFKTHKVKFSYCTLHDYFNILKKAK
jgi:hypothetical protein